MYIKARRLSSHKTLHTQKETRALVLESFDTTYSQHCVHLVLEQAVRSLSGLKAEGSEESKTPRLSPEGDAKQILLWQCLESIIISNPFIGFDRVMSIGVRLDPRRAPPAQRLPRQFFRPPFAHARSLSRYTCPSFKRCLRI